MTIKHSDLFHQCQLCKLPKAPEGLQKELLSHGMHRSCFKTWAPTFYDMEDPDDKEDYEDTLAVDNFLPTPLPPDRR